MHNRITRPMPETPFWKLFLSRSSGILHWEDMDAFWPQMQATTGEWYVFDPSQDAPVAPVSGAGWQAALDAARALVYTRRELPMSGAVYVDNRKTPAFIKVFDPSNMGTSCSCSTEPVMPKYIFSRARPDSLPLAPLPKTGLFARLRGRT